jgi:hypothetical protein
LAVDYKWFHEERAKNYALSHTFMLNQWKENNTVLVGYTHDGKVNQNYESAGAYGANLGYFYLIDPKLSNDVSF